MAGGNKDTRIVQLQFENREFERRIAKSTKSVEELKEAMDFEETSKGLEKFANASSKLDFSKLGDNIQRLTDKFTGLGNVGEYVISRIRHTLESGAMEIENFIRSISIAQIPVGQGKYDEMNKAVMTIVSSGKATESQAYSTMERIMAYTDQTSHSFNTMVSQLSNLTSIGYGLNEAERILEGIGNAATYAGQGAENAALSMSVLTKVLGPESFLGYEKFLQLQNTSRVITDKWRQQALEAAEAVGTLKKKNDKYYVNVKGQKAVEVTAENLENTLKSRWLTGAALKKLYESYAFGDEINDLKKPEDAIIKGLGKSKEAIGKKMQELFPDSNVDLLKRKVLKIGDDIATVMTETFTASADGREGLKWNQDLVMNITPITKDGKKLSEEEVNKYVEDLLNRSANIKELYVNDKRGKGLIISADVNFKSFKEGIKKSEDLAEELHELQDAYYGTADAAGSLNTEFSKKAYLTGQRALTFTDALNAMKESVSTGWMKTFRLLFGDVTEAAEHFTNIADRVIEVLEKISNFRNKILESFASNGGRKSIIQLLIGGYEDDADEVYGFIDALEGLGKLVSDAFWDFVRLFVPENLRKLWDEDQDFINKGGREAWLGTIFQRMIDGIRESIQSVRNYFNEEIDVGGKTKTRLEVISDILKGIAGVLKFGYDLLIGVIYFAGLIASQLSPSLDSILGFLGRLGEEIYGTEEAAGDSGKVKKFFTELGVAISPITSGINDCVEAITNLLVMIFGLDKEGKKQSGEMSIIGKALITIAKIISSVLGPALTFLANIITLITDVASGKISFKDFGKKLGEAFQEMMKSFADSLPDNLKVVKDAIYNLFGLWENAADEDSKSFFTFIRRLFTGGFSSFGELLGQLTNGFSLSKALETGFGFGSAFNFLNTVIGWFKGTNLYQVLLAFLGVTSLVTLIKLFNRVKLLISNMSIFFDDVGGNLARGFTGEYEWFGDRLLKIAKSIALIAVAVMILGSMDTGRMIQGIVGIAAIMAALFLLIKLLSSKMASATFAQQAMLEVLIVSLAGAVLAIALAISVLSVALIPLASDWKKMVMAIIGFAAFMLIFGAFLKIMLDVLDTKAFSMGATNQWSGVGKIAVMLIALSATMVIIAAAISILAVAITPLTLTGWGGLLRAIIGVGAFLAILGVFIVVMINQMDLLAFNLGGGGKGAWSGIGKMAVMMITLAATVALLAVGIGALVVAITPLAIMSWGGFVRAVAGLGIILVELGLMIKFIQSLSVGDKTVTLKIAGLAGFALSLGILVYALTPLSLMSWGGWARAMAGLAIVLLELAGMIFLVQKMSAADKTVTLKIAGLAGFALSIGILMTGLLPLASMDWGGWAKAMAGLAVVLAELVLFMLVTSKLPIGTGQLGGFIGFAASLAILLFAIKPLSEMSPQGYTQALVGLATIMGEMVILMAIMKELRPDIKSAFSTLIMLIGLGAAMVLFGIAFNEVKDIPWERLIGFAAAIALLLVAIAGASALAKIGGISGMLILAAGVALLVGVVALLAPIVAGSLSSALQMMAGSLNYMTAMFESFSKTMSGIDESSVDKGSNMVERFKSLFQSLMGFGSYSAGINAFSGALWDLSTTLELFQYHTRNITDPENNGGIGLIKQLSSCASDLDTITKLNIDSLTTKISGLGGAMMLYAQGAKEATGLEIGETPDVTAAVGLMTAISEALATEEGTFKIPTDLPSTNDIGLFGAQLAALAGAMVRFEEAGKGLGTGTENAKRTLTFFKELKKDLDEDFRENLTVAVGIFDGDEEGAIKIMPSQLEEFGKNIEQLAIAMATFADKTTYADQATGEIKPVNYDKAIEALTSFSDLESKLPRIGGIWSWIAGNQQTLVDLGGHIETLGKNLNEFSKHITGDGTPEHPGFDYEASQGAIKAAGEMIDFMQQMNSKLPKIGGLGNILKTLFSGRDMSLDEVGGQMSSLGDSLGKFAKGLTQGDWTKDIGVSNALAAVDAIADMIYKMAIMDDKLKTINGINPGVVFQRISEFVQMLAEGITDESVWYDGDFVTEQPPLIEGLTAFMKAVRDSIGEFANTEKDINDLKSKLEVFKLFVESLGVLTSIDGSKSFELLGTKITTDLLSSITTGSGNVVASCTSMITNSYDGATNAADWVALGTNIALGVETGVKSAGPEHVTPAVKQMMIDAYNAGKEAIDSNSPSKLFMTLGSFMGQGTAIGLQKSEGDVSDSASEMGEVALDRARDMIGLISRIMAEGTDATPTISPVLDMTNIDSGMDDFRRSLNGYGITLDTSMAANRAGRIGSSSYEEQDSTAKVDFGGIYERMAQMNEQISSLSTSIKSMKLVLDTGVLAGGVTDKVNYNLGRDELYASRRN